MESADAPVEAVAPEAAPEPVADAPVEPATSLTPEPHADEAEAPEAAHVVEAAPAQAPAFVLSEEDNVTYHPEILSAAPPRPHGQLYGQLERRWLELQDFCSTVEGDLPGVLGDLLTFVRERS